MILDPFLDPTVSAQHAEIRIEGSHFVLYDMGSLNGTYLNGHPVRRAELQKGDEISLGRRGPRLVFSVEAPGPWLSILDDGLPQAGEFRPLETRRESIIAVPDLEAQIASWDWTVYAYLTLIAIIVASWIAWLFG